MEKFLKIVDFVWRIEILLLGAVLLLSFAAIIFYAVQDLAVERAVDIVVLLLMAVLAVEGILHLSPRIYEVIVTKKLNTED